MEENDERYRLFGILGTLLFHAAVIAILCVCVMTAEVIEEDALLVEPAPASSGSSGGAPPQSTPVTQPEPVEPTPTPPADVADGQVKDTQDFEEAAALAEAKRKADEQARQERLAREEQQRIERQKAEEAERQRQEQIRQEQARQEAERKRKEEEAKRQAQRDAANSAIGKGFSNNQGTGDSRAQGTGNGTGQGNSTGNGSGNGNGNGRGNGGAGFELKGRTVEGSLPPLSYDIKEAGQVVVQITVDRNGNVKTANVQMKGTTMTNTNLHRAAEAAAKKAKFSVKSDAPVEQIGTITYHFKLE